MSRGNKHTEAQIFNKLREAEIAISEGQTTVAAAKSIGITYQTYCRWRKEYGGLRTDQARRLKELEKQNARLKQLITESELDIAIL